MGPGLGRPHGSRGISKRGEKEEPLQHLLACETTRERSDNCQNAKIIGSFDDLCQFIDGERIFSVIKECGLNTIHEKMVNVTSYSVQFSSVQSLSRV